MSESTETSEESHEMIVDNVSRDVLTVLRNYGIDTVFGIPGTHNLEFYRHLPGLGIHPVTTLHETENTRTAAGRVAEWARRVASGSEAVQAVHDAFELFRNGRPRSVAIEVPLALFDQGAAS